MKVVHKLFIVVSPLNPDPMYKQVTDQIKNAIADLELHICGEICDQLPTKATQQKGVFCHGYCNDLKAYYEKAILVVNPVCYGSGLKIKSVEAMAHGKCLVTTPIGIEGLEEYAGQAFECVDEDQMDKAIINLVNNSSRRKFFEKAALQLSKRRFTPEICFHDLACLLEKLTVKKVNKTFQDSTDWMMMQNQFNGCC